MKRCLIPKQNKWWRLTGGNNIAGLSLRDIGRTLCDRTFDYKVENPSCCRILETTIGGNSSRSWRLSKHFMEVYLFSKSSQDQHREHSTILFSKHLGTPSCAISRLLCQLWGRRLWRMLIYRVVLVIFNADSTKIRGLNWYWMGLDWLCQSTYDRSKVDHLHSKQT